MKETIMEILGSYWWIGLIVVMAIFYKPILRLFFGMVIVPEDKIGKITKKFVLFGKNRSLTGDRIIATSGEAGFQSKFLAPGLHWWFWAWQYEIEMTDFIEIPESHIGLVTAKDGKFLSGRILARKVECDNYQDAEAFLNNGGQRGRQSAYLTTGVYKINTHLFDVSIVEQVSIQEGMVGIIQTLDGAPLETGQIAGKEIPSSVHNNFQDFDAFLEAGGDKGIQQQVIQSGTYYLNPWAIRVEEHPLTEIPIGTVGVVMSYYGKDGVDVTGSDFKHGNLVSAGQRGVLVEPLNPGKYPINKYTAKVEIVPTTNLVLNWANARSESHNLDKHLSTITVRSKDGFKFNLDVSQIIHIPMNEAPKVIARFGSMNNLVSQVLEPTIGNYFRNSAQDSDAISFLISRQERQRSAKEHISKVLDEYNVHAVDTLIGDIVPPDELMKTLTDRKIAEQQEITFDIQKKAQQKRQTLERETAIAEMQSSVVRAEQDVLIAEKTAEAVVKKQRGDSESITIAAKADAEATEMRAKAESIRISMTGNAEAEAILAKGKSNAESYQLAVESMGQDNFTSFKVTEEISKSGMKLIPDVLVGGGGNGGGGTVVEGLLAMQIMDKLKQGVNSNNPRDIDSEVLPSKESKKK
jgi:uncharacterized membrane protein YqiK